ncbi:hypothetical protein CRM22_001785 [Opisthorchis felineus]|uniref:Ubiquitin-conjugating enzyme E2 Z n=1 Tax=Opisthorchis felineus TaxID=147828 RepID=A0A4S2M8Z2_OPIFE|nr:hypothetical protein CRM22_001785 [Opisthorchis felineus]
MDQSASSQQQEYQYFMSQTGEAWDPETRSNQKSATGNACLLRITKDLRTIYSDPAPGIVVAPDEADLTKVHALITGPFDTPYEGGFFLFLIRFPPEYPLKPPRVKLMTTGNGTVRFNPNLYKNGKVCLSILGTWTGPEWTPAQSLWSVLVSIQSLMNDEPYYNEPGFRHEHSPGDSKRYNNIIQHETIRCAVCDVLEGRSWCPPDLLGVIQSSFEEYYDQYMEVCEKNAQLTGQPMNDPFGEQRGSFDFVTLSRRLKDIRAKLKKTSNAGGDAASSGPNHAI